MATPFCPLLPLNQILTTNAGSLPYLAPEVLQHNKVTKAGDVYSFAILLLEMWTGSVAYQDQNYHGVSSLHGIAIFFVALVQLFKSLNPQ